MSGSVAVSNPAGRARISIKISVTDVDAGWSPKSHINPNLARWDAGNDYTTRYVT